MSFQLHRDGQYIPCDLNTLREMARKGELAQDEYVFDERVREWVGAAQIAEMKDAWSIGENEATVAMELTPEMLAMFDQVDASKAKAPAAQAVQPEPQRPPEPQRQAAPVAPPAARPEPELRQAEVGPSIREAPRPQGSAQPAPRKSNRPTGEILDPTMTTIKNLVCFVLAILWLIKRYDEVNNFFGEKRFTWWHLLIPIWGIVVMWKFFNAIGEMAEVVGATHVPRRASMYLIGQLCTSGILTFYLMQTDLNAIWEHMGARKAA